MKVNSLKDKIKEYVLNELKTKFFINNEDMANTLADICEKEYEKTNHGYILKMQIDKIDDLQNQNSALVEKNRILETDNMSMSNKLFKTNQENTDLKDKIKDLEEIQKVIIHWVNQQSFPNKVELSKILERNNHAKR